MSRKTAKQVLLEGCSRLNVTTQEIMAHNFKRPVARKRQEIMFDLFTQCPHLTYPGIGRFLGRDHTTVLFGVRQHCERIGISYDDAIIRRINAHDDPRKVAPAWTMTIRKQEVFSAVMAEYDQAMRIGMGRECE